MTFIVDGTNGATFPDTSTQAKAGLVAGGTIATGTITTLTSTTGTVTTLTSTTISDGTNSTSSTNCIQGSAKAWVQFNGSTGTINASYNISSVTRTGTGLYTIAFTTAFTDANYVVTTAGQRSSTNTAAFASPQYNNNPTTTTLYLATYENTAGALDLNKVYVACFR